MARQVKRISELPEATELTGDELLEIVQDGGNKRVAVDQLSGDSATGLPADISVFGGAAYYPNIATHECTDGWLFSGDAVLNADGSQVVCDPVPIWRVRAERLE